MPSRFAHLRLSISARLTLWYGLSLLLLLSLFVVFLYTSFHVSLHRDFEAMLRRDEAGLRATVRLEGRQPVLDEAEALRVVALQTDGPSGTYARLLSPSGDVVYQSPNFSDHPSLGVTLPATAQPAVVSRLWQSGPARSRYVPLHDGQERLAAWLEVTRLESTMHRELHRLRWLLALGILLSAAVAIGSGYALARRALRPVAAITRAARTIEAETLDHPLPARFGVRDELTDLAETLNDLLTRLDASFERERRFRADAAHEIFTPISALLSEIEVALRKPREAAYYRQTLGTLQDHARRLSGLVENLLRLSRAEATGHRGDGAATDASAITHRVAERFVAAAEAQSLHLSCTSDSVLYAAIDLEPLEAVLENLLDNAIKYTPPGGQVKVVTAIQGGEAVISVADTGVGFTQEEAARLFDRFYRADSRPIQQVRGSGLGLSIASAVVEGYGGRIMARSEGPGRGSTFEVRLPLAEPERISLSVP